MKSLITSALVLFLFFSLGCNEVKESPLPISASEVPSYTQRTGHPSANENIFNLIGLTTDENGNTVIPPAAPPSTPLYYRRTQLPILAPDGHHITAGEYAAAKGTAEVTCIGQGTQVKIHLTGLVPNAEYRIWLLTFKSPGFDLSWPNPFINLIGNGAMGPNDRSRNTFHASASGKGTIVRFMPDGSLSEFGAVGDCLLEDVFEFHLIGAFQQPGQDSGTEVGPPALFPFSAVEQFGFIFVP